MPRGTKKVAPAKNTVESRDDHFDDDDNTPDSQQSSIHEGQKSFEKNMGQ